MTRAAHLAGAFAVLACACTPKTPTQFLAVVDTDILSPNGSTGAIDFLFADAARPDVVLASRRVQATATTSSPGASGGVLARVPFSFAITPVPDASPQRLLVVARMGVQGGNLDRAVETRAIVSFRDHEKLLLPLFLDRACANVRDVTAGVDRPLCQPGYNCVVLEGQPRCTPVALAAPLSLDPTADPAPVARLVLLGRQYLRGLALPDTDAGVSPAPDADAMVVSDGGDGGGTGSALRLIEPAPAAELATRLPVFHFELAAPGMSAGLRLVLCRDRACAMPTSLTPSVEAGVRGTAAAVAPLDAGLWWWHVEGATLRSDDRPLWIVGDGAPDLRAWHAAPDFDGDGYGDVVALRMSGGAATLSVVSDTGAGPLTLRDPPSVQPVLRRLNATTLRAIGDVDTDNTVDFAIAQPGSPVEVFDRDGPVWSVAAPASLGARTFAVALSPAGDVDRDGTADMLIGSAAMSPATTDVIHHLRGTRRGSPVMTDIDVGDRCFAADANAQLTVVQNVPWPLPAVFVGCPALARVRGFVLARAGDTAAPLPDLMPGAGDATRWGRSVATVGDFDSRTMHAGRDALVVTGDTRADIFLFSSSTDTVTRSTRATLCLRADCMAVASPVPGLRAIGVGDLNGDGFHDVALTSTDGTLRVYLGRSNIVADDNLPPVLVMSIPTMAFAAGIGASDRADALADLAVAGGSAGATTATLYAGHASAWMGGAPMPQMLPFASTDAIVDLAR